MEWLFEQDHWHAKVCSPLYCWIRIMYFNLEFCLHPFLNLAIDKGHFGTQTQPAFDMDLLHYKNILKILAFKLLWDFLGKKKVDRQKCYLDQHQITL